MNKDEIKEALETCILGYCTGCPYDGCDGDCRDELHKDALALITEQENEIERVKKENAYLLKACEEPFTFNTTQNKKYSVFNTVRKEFAEKVKAKAVQEAEVEDYVRYIVDRILKEYEK